MNTLEQMIDDVDDVVSKMNRMIKNLDTPSPCNGRNVANALRELRDELCESICMAQEFGK